MYFRVDIWGIKEHVQRLLLASDKAGLEPSSPDSIDLVSTQRRHKMKILKSEGITYIIRYEFSPRPRSLPTSILLHATMSLILEYDSVSHLGTAFFQ